MMSHRTNQEYLKNDQYADAGNLNARIELHRRFSTNSEDWFRWVFDQLNLTESIKILELGCGPGLLWNHNLDRLSSPNQIILSDFSFGMIKEAQQNTIASSCPIIFTQLDAQAIPYPMACFDLVIANHMLYHVPNRAHAISEIHRILKPGGKLVAATNGIEHMAEIRHILLQLDPILFKHSYHAFGVNEFTIENGTDQLTPWFKQVNIIPFIDSLEVTEADPLVKYILSMVVGTSIEADPGHKEKLFHNIDQLIARNGSIHITKTTALFLAHKSSIKAKRTTGKTHE